MNRDDIERRLAEVAGTVLGVDPELMSDTASPETLGNWTSVAHLSLIAAVEETFSIHLTVVDIYAAQNFATLRRIVLEHVARGAS